MSKRIPHNKKTFTNPQVKRIIRLYNRGDSAKQIGKIFQVSSTTILKYLNEWGINTSGRIYSVNHDFFEVIDTEAKAYWLGFISADGNIFKNVLTIGISKKDTNHLHKFLRDIESNYPLRHNSGNIVVAITSKKLVSDLKKLGVTPRKSKTIKPASISAHLLIHYWRGIIDGDGSMRVRRIRKHIYPNIQLSGNKYMCSGFREWCLNYVESNAKLYKNKVNCQFEIVGAGAGTIIKTLYQGSHIYLDRKYNQAENILKESYA